jgi:hypothetical protein
MLQVIWISRHMYTAAQPVTTSAAQSADACAPGSAYPGIGLPVTWHRYCRGVHTALHPGVIHTSHAEALRVHADLINMERVFGYMNVNSVH